MSLIQSSYKDKSNNVLLFKIEVDHLTEVISGIHFSGDLVSAHLIQLNAIRSFSIGKTVNQVLESSYSELFHKEPLELISLVHGLLFQCLNDFKGRSETLNPSADMLCLCFGISKKEILGLINSQPQIKLSELIAQTKMTSACGSCLRHIEELLGDKLISSDKNHSKEILISGMNVDDLLVYADHKISTWLKKENLTDILKVTIVSISGAHIFLNVQTVSLELTIQTDLIKKLNIYLNQQLRAQVFLHF